MQDVGLIGCGALRGLWALYACSVRRLGSEKRNAANFIGFLGLLRSCGCLLWFVLCLSLGLLWLLRSCCLWVSFGLWVVLLAFFPYRTKRKRSAFICAPSLLGFGVFILNYPAR